VTLPARPARWQQLLFPQGTTTIFSIEASLSYILIFTYPVSTTNFTSGIVIELYAILVERIIFLSYEC
jgi:hypothetical protein